MCLVQYKIRKIFLTCEVANYVPLPKKHHQYFMFLFKQHLTINISNKNMKLLIFVTAMLILNKNIKY